MKSKKMLAGFLAGALLAGGLPAPVAALTDEEIKAPSAVLMEAQTGKVLYEKNPHEQRPCASITKVMTVLLVMEALDAGKISLEDTVTASEHAASMGGSDIWLKPGETMSVDEMLRATVIASANDAAVALAEHVAGSEDDFLRQMNEKAAELGMKDTVFKNCNGLDEDGHVSSAYDVALMSRALIQHKKIFDYSQVWIDNLRGGQTQLVNTNKLLKSYKGITGLKTGTTGKAGSCISATAERDGVSLIGVILGSENTKDRFASAAALLDYGFANWSVVQPELPACTPIPVTGGMQPTVETNAAAEESILVPKGRGKDLSFAVTMEESVPAPVAQGQVVGRITCTLDGETVKEYEICASAAVPEITFGACFQLLLQGLVCAKG